MGEFWSGPIPAQFEPDRMVSRRKDWSGFEFTDAMLERAWEKQDSTETIWVQCRASGYLTEACRLYRLKHPGAERAGLRQVAGTKGTASSPDS